MIVQKYHGGTIEFEPEKLQKISTILGRTHIFIKGIRGPIWIKESHRYVTAKFRQETGLEFDSEGTESK